MSQAATPPLDITNVEIRLACLNDDKLKAFAAITISNCFVVRDLKIIYAPNRRLVAMPSRRDKDGIFHDYAHPINQATRDHIEAVVLKAFDERMEHEQRTY